MQRFAVTAATSPPALLRVKPKHNSAGVISVMHTMDECFVECNLAKVIHSNKNIMNNANYLLVHR
jgi:hypothetical protein